MKNINYLNEEIAWNSTNNPEYPYQSVHNGKKLLIRLNDFPAEHLYTLIADAQEVTNFDDWATTWNRPPKTVEKSSARSSSTAKATIRSCLGTLKSARGS